MQNHIEIETPSWYRGGFEKLIRANIPADGEWEFYARLSRHETIFNLATEFNSECVIAVPELSGTCIGNAIRLPSRQEYIVFVKKQKLDEEARKIDEKFRMVTGV